MAQAPSIGAGGGDERAFLQARIARFGALFGLIAAGFWLAAAAVYIGQGKAEAIWAPSSISHALGAITLAVMWLWCRRGIHDRWTLLVVETVGITASAGALGIAALELKLEQRPELVLVIALTHLLVLRAVVVPSTARHSLVIGVAIGVVIVPLVFVRYYGEPEFLARASLERSLAVVTVWTVIWWSVSVATTTLISKVIYGLRRDVRAAEQLGQYTLDKRLGTGGMGEVWRATHGMLRRPAAIKLIKPESLTSGHVHPENTLARFEREAQVIAALESPHTVEMYDFGISEGGVLYHVIELLHGCDLDLLVEKFGAQPPERVIHLLRQVCDSLEDAHSAGLVHRDIKPANIFLARKGRRFDFIKVLDFGLVQPHRADASADGGLIVGTPAFMPPEMLRGEAADRRADLYALGCVAYWLLTGVIPFDGPDARAIAQAHAEAEPVPPSQRSGLPIPPQLDAVVLACLEKDPADRPTSGLVLDQQLRGIQIFQPWTNQRAEAWWSEHRPERLGLEGEGALATGPSRLLRPAHQ